MNFIKDVATEFIAISKGLVWLFLLLTKAFGPILVGYTIAAQLTDVYPWYISLPLGILLVVLGAAVTVCFGNRGWLR